ncbi:MAG: hypothetical protein QXJ14_03525 [Candidatus Aenigmatarchaeota archaeon]
MATSVGASITGALGLAVKAAGDQERANLLLASAMKTAGIYTDRLYNSLVNYAGQLQKTTKYSDDAIMSAQRILIQFGATGDQINSLTQATLDFASALGMDLNTAALLIGKTITGEMNSLARYGISLKNVKDESERVKIVTEKIAELFGGTAKTEAETFSGSIEQLKNMIGDTAEKIGFILLPYLKNFIEKAKDVIDRISNWIDKNRGLLDILVPLVAKIGLVLTAIGGISLALPKLIGLWGSFNTLLNVSKTILTGHPLFLLPATLLAIYEAANLVVNTYNKQKEYEASLNKTLEGRIKWYEQEIEKIKSKKKLTEEDLQTIAKYEKAIQNLQKTIEEQKNKEIELLKKSSQQQQQTQRQYEAFMVKSYKTIYEKFQDALLEQKVLFGATYRDINKIVYNSLSYKTKLWLEFKNTVNNVWSSLTESISQGITNWRNSLTTFIGVVGGAFREIQTYLSDVIFAGIKGGWSDMMDAIHQLSGQLADRVLNIFTDYLAGHLLDFMLFTMLPTIISFLRSVFEAVKSGAIKNVIIYMYEAIAAAVKWLIATLGPWGALAAVGAVALITAYYADIRRKIERIKLAEGGIVTRPVHALIGEAGPEAVIPLNKFKLATTSGLTININIQGTLIEGNELKWEEITRKHIIRPIQKWLSKSGDKLR